MASALANKVLFGLKVQFNFSDIESKATALNNLGLDIRDLEVIRGISDSINKIDLQNVSGLDTNLTRYLDRLKSDTSRYRNLVNNLAGYNYSTKGNLEAYGPVSGGAVRFKYIPNDGGVGQNASNLKYGDISTSRVSSWSSATSDETNLTQAISYGGSVQVKRDLKIGQSSSFFPQSSECLLNVLDTPEPIRFTTEVATDMIKVNINGTEQYIYAMRGIPFIFTTAFKTIAMDFQFGAFQVGGVNQSPIFTFKATDDSESEIVSQPSAINNNLSQLRYSAQSYKERDIRVYFPPKNIKGITGNGINLRQLPAAKFQGLESITLESNLLGEMPDWRTINYIFTLYPTRSPASSGPYSKSLSNGTDTYAEPSTTLTSINLNYNPLYLSEDEELMDFGTNITERFPSDLRTLSIHGTYREDSKFHTADTSLVIYAGQANNNSALNQLSSDDDYNFINCDPVATQEYPFDNLESGLTVKGIFYDKQIVDGYCYIYVDAPTVKLNGVEVTSSTTFSGTGFGQRGFLQPLDIRTRCPKLQNFYMGRSGSEVIYQTAQSQFPSYINSFLYTTGIEVAPRVNIKTIETYYIRSNGFSRLGDEFENPGTYLDGSDTSALREFDVYDNDGLTSPNLDFTRMTDIRSIVIGDTNLPIPLGLPDKTTLGSVSCSYSRFPGRGDAPVWNTTTGEGNPSNANNFLFSTKEAPDKNGYVFKGCTGLGSFSFYASTMDGFFPKLIGNNGLTSIDLRNTAIEGGRPQGNENGGNHGRRYIMWNDTFEDAQSITEIRIRSSVLGRNIGIYDPATQTYSQAAFEGATFNLPVLSTLEILCPEKRIRGEFFDPSQAPSLQTLSSYSTGWGLDVVDQQGNVIGAQFPSFAGNPAISYVRLEDNNFTGNLSLTNLSNLSEFYVSANDITAITGWSSLPSLQEFSLSNNSNCGPDLPNFSAGSPNIKNIACNNCNFLNYTDGTFSTCTRIRTVDLQNNSFNTQTIDTILSDLVDNYNNAPRGGVVINLKDNAPPSSIPISIPTESTSLAQTESITVDQDQFTEAGYFITVTNTDPGEDGILGTEDDIVTTEQQWVATPQDPQYIFYLATANIRDGFDPPGQSQYEYETKIFLNGVDITSNGTITIDYAGDVITFNGNSPGNVVNYPPHGSTISIEVWQTVYGTRIEYTGGIVLKNFLSARGWILRTD